MTGSTLLRSNLRQQVLELVRGELMAGQMAPGSVYSATALAERFGASTSPVREALLSLVDDGLLSAVPNRGFRVVELTVRDFREVVELRRWLEIPGVGKSAENGLGSRAEVLWRLVEEIERHAAARDLTANLAADREFHLELLAASGNGRLVGTVARLRDQTRLHNIAQLTDAGDLLASAAEHRPLLAAVAAGDRERAEALTAAHLDHLDGDWTRRPGH